MSKPKSEGWTYFIQADTGGPVKIGFTTRTPDVRLKDLQCGSPVTLVLLGAISGNEETTIHRSFKRSRLHGEWFTPNFALRRFIATHCDCNVRGEKLTIPGAPVARIVARPQPFAERYCDLVVPRLKDGLKNENFLDELLYRVEWNVGDEWPYSDEELEEAESTDESLDPYDVAQKLVLLVENDNFVDQIALNCDTGLVFIVCGELNSNHRVDLIKQFCLLAHEMDGFTDFWYFCAVVLTRRGQLITRLFCRPERVGQDTLELIPILKYQTISRFLESLSNQSVTGVPVEN